MIFPSLLRLEEQTDPIKTGLLNTIVNRPWNKEKAALASATAELQGEEGLWGPLQPPTEAAKGQQGLKGLSVALGSSGVSANKSWSAVPTCVPLGQLLLLLKPMSSLNKCPGSVPKACLKDASKERGLLLNKSGYATFCILLLDPCRAH